MPRGRLPGVATNTWGICAARPPTPSSLACLSRAIRYPSRPARARTDRMSTDTASTLSLMASQSRTKTTRFKPTRSTVFARDRHLIPSGQQRQRECTHTSRKQNGWVGGPNACDDEVRRSNGLKDSVHQRDQNKDRYRKQDEHWDLPGCGGHARHRTRRRLSAEPGLRLWKPDHGTDLWTEMACAGVARLRSDSVSAARRCASLAAHCARRRSAACASCAASPPTGLSDSTL